jgi:Zn-finger nucleic acid-binding protein
MENENSFLKTEKICPECKHAMGEYDRWWIIVDECSYCSWIFFDYNELKWVIDSTPDYSEKFEKIQRWDNISDHPQTLYPCVTCWKDMKERTYLYDSWIHIDFCEDCFSIYTKPRLLDGHAGAWPSLFLGRFRFEKTENHFLLGITWARIILRMADLQKTEKQI